MGEGVLVVEVVCPPEEVESLSFFVRDIHGINCESDNGLDSSSDYMLLVELSGKNYSEKNLSL